MSVPTHAPVATTAVSVPRSFDEAYRAMPRMRPTGRATWGAQHRCGGRGSKGLLPGGQPASRQLSRRGALLHVVVRDHPQGGGNHRRSQRWRFWRTDGKLAKLASPVPRNPAELERQQSARLFDRTRIALVLFENEMPSTRDIADLCHLRRPAVECSCTGRANSFFCITNSSQRKESHE